MRLMRPFHSQSRFPVATRIVVIILAAMLFAESAVNTSIAADATVDDESWQVTYVNDQRVGYSRSRTRSIERDGREIIRTTIEEHLKFKRFGQAIELESNTQYDESVDGRILEFALEMKNPPSTTNRTVGRIEGNRLYLESTTGGRAHKTEAFWDHSVKSPSQEDALLTDPPLKPGDSRSYKKYEPMLNKVVTVKVMADDYRTVKLLGGQREKLLKVRIMSPELPPIRMYLDETGEALRTEMDALGMVTYSVSKEVAMEELAGEELDFAIATLVPVDPIRQAHRKERIVYRITSTGDDPSEYLTEGPTQKIDRVDSRTVELTVSAVRPNPFGRSSKTDPEFLQSTRFLQSDDAKVRDHARRAAAGQADPIRIAESMEKYVHDRLTEKNFSTALASAAEVAEKMEGDCTEHAVLLAAMLRAKKIPSRIATGLVYVTGRNAFGGHMWTEAYLGGQWIPLDATLGEGGIGAGHIKFADSSFADDAPAPVSAFLPLMNLLGTISIEVVDDE